MNKTTPIWISLGYNKTQHIPSINTSTLTNRFCLQKQKQPDTVCSRCYSKRNLKRKIHLNNHCKINSEILSTKRLDDNELPRFNNLYVRFNSHGELINKIHLDNLINTAIINPQTTFALWTKRTNLIIATTYIPPNMIIVYSSHYINREEELPPYADKVFTIYTQDYIKKHNIILNCTQKCIKCLKCYTFNDITYIREKLK